MFICNENSTVIVNASHIVSVSIVTYRDGPISTNHVRAVLDNGNAVELFCAKDGGSGESFPKCKDFIRDLYSMIQKGEQA